MTSKLRYLLTLLLMAPVLSAHDCLIEHTHPDDDDSTPADDDDDDVVPDDDDVVADDDDATPEIGDTTISGAVIATDRESGAILSADEYNHRVGGLIVYALADGNDLSVVLGKDTLTGPGQYEITISGWAGPVDLVAVVDEDQNYVIDSSDVLREHAFNPLLAEGNDQVISGVNVYVDLERRDGGGGDDDDDDGGCDRTLMNGDVTLVGYPDGPVVVTTNSADLSAGPRELAALPGPQDWGLTTECNGHGTTAVLGSLDADGNGFWEPSDPWGDAPANPYVLGLGDINGVSVIIPSTEPISPPSPTPYVHVSGTVTYDAFSTGDILVRASAVNTNGQLFSELTLAAPGAFDLIVPPGTENVLVWAVLDDDSDGDVDVYVDPFDSEGPMDVGTGVSGIDLELDNVPPLPGTISGSLSYSGDADPADCAKVGLFDEEPSGPAIAPLELASPVVNPTYPLAFQFTDVIPGQYWIAAYHDTACDSVGPQPDDPDGRTEYPVLVGSEQDVTGVNIALEE